MRKSRLRLCTIVGAAVLALISFNHRALEKYAGFDYEPPKKSLSQEKDLSRLSIPEFICITEEFPELAEECNQEYAAFMAASYKKVEQTISDYRKVEKLALEIEKKFNRKISIGAKSILTSSDENLGYTIPEFEKGLKRFPKDDDKALAGMAASWKGIDEVFSDYDEVKILVPEVKYDDVSASNMASSFEDLKSYVIPRFKEYKKQFPNISNNAASTMASVHEPYNSRGMDDLYFHESSESWTIDDYIKLNEELLEFELDDVSLARMAVAYENAQTWTAVDFRDIKLLVPIISRQRIPYVSNRAAAIMSSSFYFGRKE